MIRPLYIMLASVVVPSMAVDCLVAGQAGSQQQVTYFYSGDERVAVRIARDRVAVRLRVDAPADALSNLMQRHERLRVTEPGELEQFTDQRIHILPLEVALARSDFDSALDQLSRDAAVEMAGTVVVLEDSGAPLVMTDRVVVGFKESVPADTMADVYRRFDVELVETSERREKRVLLRVRATSDRNALEVANAIYETGWAAYAHPDFYARTERRGRG